MRRTTYRSAVSRGAAEDAENCLCSARASHAESAEDAEQGNDRRNLWLRSRMDSRVRGNDTIPAVVLANAGTHVARADGTPLLPFSAASALSA